LDDEGQPACKKLGVVLLMVFARLVAPVVTTTTSIQCSKWSKKEVGSLRKPRSSAPSPEFFLFIFDLKTASFDAFLVVFYAI